MNVNQNLLEKQIKTLSKQLNKKLTATERSHIEGLLNMLGDLSDTLKGPASVVKTLIEVRGGIVQAVRSNRKDAEYLVIDYDKKDAGENPVGTVSAPDYFVMQDERGEMFYERFNDSSDPEEMEVRECLKRLKF